MERLQKFLARVGVASRRASENLIQSGRVKVNGKAVTTLGTKIRPESDEIAVDNIPISIPEQKVYLLLNKPQGCLTTTKDDRGRKTVLDLVKSVKQRVYPVGRLDYDTEGLLILTNDGDLAYTLTHPKYEVNKTYHALVKGKPAVDKLQKLRCGIMLDDRKTAPAQIRVLKYIKENSLIEIIVHEGRNRQIKRMFDQIDHPVLNLKRVRIGPLDAKGLPVGKFRYLNSSELQELIGQVKH